ncbi:MAG TPA: hypothetical protein DCG12_04580 [Planctomycetaceae bacterium]|nr:hypothetical protein [Planctomycetaceae bacterium]
MSLVNEPSPGARSDSGNPQQNRHRTPLEEFAGESEDSPAARGNPTVPIRQCRRGRKTQA